MSTDEIFNSMTRTAGDLAGVFEYDGATGYFYLYETTGNQGQRVVGVIRLMTTEPDFEQGDVEVRWDRSENNVGLFIRGRLWGAFDGITKTGFGGDYRPDGQAEIPKIMANSFEATREA